MKSVFSKLISGELPCYKIAESDEFLAFLDINPNTLGHTLCIPKKTEDKVFDLSEQEYLRLMNFSRKVALAIRKSVKCKRVGISVIGLEVPHVHVHLIPLNEMDDITFQKKTKVDSKIMTQLSKRIASNFNLI
jgi:histidine triad (HIT) family protein|tara:strand:+ start:3695 stop:4093 length:399 start_codon:yes stop_codon:yes gene_type:complete